MQTLSALPSMPQLLRQAGLTFRSATRADCAQANCTGRSRATVSFTDEVAFCHRCGWRANCVTLARDLGILRDNPAIRSALREQAGRRSCIDKRLAAFDAWREARWRAVRDKYRALSFAAVDAAERLRANPEDEKAWAALGNFTHGEAELRAATDFLFCTVGSVWLEEDSSPVELFETWGAACS